MQVWITKMYLSNVPFLRKHTPRAVDLSFPTNTNECKESNNNNTPTPSLVFISISITHFTQIVA